MHIFHYQEEGYLLVDEFIEIFNETEKILDMINLLHTFNIRVQFKEIDRTKNSLQFIKTSR